MLSDIASGITVTEEQRRRGVATVDGTGDDLASGLAPFERELPCSASGAAAIADAYASGSPVEAAGETADASLTTAAKALHLLGFEGMSPLSPDERDIVRDWCRGRRSRAEARALVDATDAEFALAAYVAIHDPIDGAVDVVEGNLYDAGEAAVAKRDRLAETMSDATDLRTLR